MRLGYDEVASVLGVPGTGRDIRLARAVTDSREAGEGALFVCVKGEHVDGHDFAAQAQARGASAVLAARMTEGCSLPHLIVPDTVQALGRIAAHWRRGTRAKVVGITGTAGKTTVKEVLAHVCSLAGPTAKNEANHNNQLGMPRDMLETTGDEAFWIFEAGISREGDMDELGGILAPDLAVLLNAGAGHVEGLGERGVAWHKARLLAHLAPGGSALVCADYPELADRARETGARLHLFGSDVGGSAPAFRGRREGECPGDVPRGRYRLWLEGEEMVVAAPFLGRWGLEDTLAVASAAWLLGVDREAIREGLDGARLPQGRFTRVRRGGWDVVDDTYNANPLSMAASLEAAAILGRGAPLAFALGEMRELGDVAPAEHEALGRAAGALHPVAVFWKGGFGELVAKGLADAGCPDVYVPVEDPGDFAARFAALSERLGRGGLLLLKGSRANRLESFLDALPQGEDWKATGPARGRPTGKRGPGIGVDADVKG
ncbi:MAG: UDP-N-acetylmuramoyl-tripeptide--D-alanyl-D-alanine ligase [Desulfovibrio sp.]|jgi:UDP-N-acetylmuramoyl-tripeptide--D-alanyl-D-alanine ligase|nr:UDP-N-acetylmuramoyl-tripeptide--D-alanyl-D-alanine ligase [Desulfovibrio sp.]